MDQRVKDHLIRQGHMSEGGATRRAVVNKCPACGRYTFFGLDNDICAFETRADLRPLTAFDEVVALTADLFTYELRYVGGRYELTKREPEHVASRPANPEKNYEVLAQHLCGVSIGTGPNKFRGQTSTGGTDENEKPPY